MAVLAVAAANVRWTCDDDDDDDDGSSYSSPVRGRWKSVTCTGHALHRGGGVADGMCAVSRAPENVSRTSVAFGVASLAILVTGFVTGSWVTTREPYRVPGSDAYTAAAFRIGLWKICPTLKNINSTSSEYTSRVLRGRCFGNVNNGGGSSLGRKRWSKTLNTDVGCTRFRLESLIRSTRSMRDH